MNTVAEPAAFGAAAGTTVPNSVVIQPDSFGRICFWSHAPTDVVIDLQGDLNR